MNVSACLYARLQQFNLAHAGPLIRSFSIGGETIIMVAVFNKLKLPLHGAHTPKHSKTE